ncbi:MAG: MlaD family protein [Spirochaetaceae bacterium]|jgi:phospholipid/cholesterol/gamma-HCH transport system substrate-binding protein|nr:MlaD family protein [Spirochaetaceae bacterium]
MKFKMRFVDQIVGIFIIIAILALIFVVLMLGKTQRWFSRTYSYKTFAASASGLNQNMPVTLKGIPIGNVKSFRLTPENQVEVIFSIHDEYRDRAKLGSLIEILVSPIGLGSQFIFYPGLGETIMDEGALVPMHNSAEGREYLTQGLAYIPPHEDSIAVLVGNAQAVLNNLQQTTAMINAAFAGDDLTALGQSINNIKEITEDLSSPRGISKLLSGEGAAISSLESSFVSLAQTLDHIEQTTRYIPREMPQILNLLSKARTALQNAEDVLISLKNNPILRGGIPEHVEVDSSGTNPRNIAF